MRFSNPLSRRFFLRGAGGVTIGLPFLTAMELRRSHAAALGGRQNAKRFVTFFFSNGVNEGLWNGGGADAAYTLPEILKPMEPLKNKLVLLNGVGMRTARDNDGNAHVVGMTNLLTARKFTDGQGSEHGILGWGAGITLDVEIGKRLPTPGGFESLQFGVQTMKHYATAAESYLSYSGSKAQVPAQDDPAKMFERVFGGLWAPPAGSGVVPSTGGLDPAVQAALMRRKSILNFVMDDYRSFVTKLGPEDKRRVDRHLEEIDAIQKRIDFSGADPMGGTSGGGAVCTTPETPSFGDVNDKAQFANNAEAQQKLLTAALACRRTRSATFQWSCAQSGTVHSWVGASEYHHPLSHKTDGGAQDQLKKIQTWYMSRLFDFCKALDDIPDEGGTLLDNTLVLVCSEVGVGHTHDFGKMPFALVGGAGGALNTGRLLKYTDASHNDLYVSILNLMGLEATTFGDPAYCKGPLPGLA